MALLTSTSTLLPERPTDSLVVPSLPQAGTSVGQLAYDALQEARGRAIMGDVRRAAGLIAYAGDLIGPAVVQLGEAPPWHYYRSQATWDLEVGRSYLYIPGRARDAARLLEGGLAVTPEADVEWMASYHEDLARARKLSA